MLMPILENVDPLWYASLRGVEESSSCGGHSGIRTLLYLVNSQVRNHYAKCPESGFYGKRGSEIGKNEIR